MAEYEVVREVQNLCANNQMRDVFFDALGKMTLSPRGLSDEDRTAGATRAIEYSIAFYDRNRDLLGRNGKLERLKKMQEKGTLRQYVEANLYRPDDK